MRIIDGIEMEDLRFWTIPGSLSRRLFMIIFRLNITYFEQNVEVVIGVMICHEMPEESVRIAAVVNDGGLAENTDDCVGRVGGPTRIHVYLSMLRVILNVGYSKTKINSR